jgi:hypothetical protein
MFSTALILAGALPMALGAISLNAPTNVTSGLVSNVTWTAGDTDPVFTLELNHPSFSSSLALANNVDPTLEVISIEWPIVPADVDYSLSAVNVTNINAVFAQSGDFAIAQAPTTGVSASVSTTFVVSSSSGASGSATPSGTNTATSSSGATTGASAASSSAAPTQSQINGNGAPSLKTGSAATGVAVAILATVAGATLFL